MRTVKSALYSLFFVVLLSACALQRGGRSNVRTVWSPQQANEWYARQGWLVGSNYTPAYAINQLEMWQPQTFDTARIALELSWAQAIGMNTMRVFLHDLLYRDDSLGLFSRMEAFLRIADRHRIKTMFVLFDSVWDPNPQSGKQRDPKPYTHNSGWVQSPGAAVLKDTTQYPYLERYVKGVVGRFGSDARVLCWDVWNEPDNDNRGPYGVVELPNKIAYVYPLLNEVFHWARSVNPQQPLTAAVWGGNWAARDSLKPIDRLMIEQSDVISFHNYDDAQEFSKRVQWLQQYGKPLLCTEYMARPRGSTFEAILPIMKRYNIAAYNWGFVQGKSQTIYPWDSWDKAYTGEPDLWFHDIFRTDGQPYKSEEVTLVKTLTSNTY